MIAGSLSFRSVANHSGKSLLFLGILSLVFFIGLGHVHLFDWDEINFAESAREMIESGDYLRIQINYSPFWEKPPFFIWLQVASMQLFGVGEFAARFPNALFGFVYLMTFYFIGKHHYDGKFGLIWALLFFASLLPHIYFKSGIIDPVFNYFIFLSIYFMIRALNRIDKDKFRYFALLSGVFSGLSVITKGPVGFLILGLTLFVYLVFRRFKKFPKATDILLFIAGFAAILIFWLSLEVYQNGFAIIQQFITYQVELFNTPVAGHEQPFFYHFVVVFFGCFPMSVLALPEFRKSKSESPQDLRLWMQILFWTVLILFSIVSTKIIHYSSMTYVPLSFLATISIYKALEADCVRRWMEWLFLSVGLLTGIAILAVPLIILNKQALYPLMNDPFAVASLKAAPDWNGTELTAGIVFILLTLVSFALLHRKKIEAFIITIASNMMTTLLFVLYLVLPKIEQITQGPMIRFCEKLQGKDVYIAAYGFKSYAHYFYARVPYDTNEKRKDLNWLLNGDTDKDVYMVSKITNTELDLNPAFRKISTEGGFNFYVRLSKNNE